MDGDSKFGAHVEVSHLWLSRSIQAEPRLQHVTRWLLGTTTHGALLLPPPSSAAASFPSTDSYHVSHTGRGETFLGLPPFASLAAPADSLAALQVRSLMMTDPPNVSFADYD